MILADRHLTGSDFQ